jgi:hypothetical protein
LALAAAALATLAGCADGYDTAAESSAPAATDAAQTAAAAPAEATPGAAADGSSPPDVNSSGPVGKTILAPTDALD